MNSISLEQLQALYQKALIDNENPEIRGNREEDLLRGRIDTLRELINFLEG